MLSNELKARLRLLTGADESATDDDLIASLADEAEMRFADLKTAGEQVTALSAQVAAKEAKVLELSASAPKQPDPLSLSLIGESFVVEREQLAKSGVLSENGCKELEAVFVPNGKPTSTALSLSADSSGMTRPLWTRVCRIIRDNPGIKIGNAVLRASAAAAPVHQSMGDVNQADAETALKKERDEAEAWRNQELKNRGLATA